MNEAEKGNDSSIRIKERESKRKPKGNREKKKKKVMQMVHTMFGIRLIFTLPRKHTHELYIDG